MTSIKAISGYRYSDAERIHAHRILLPALDRLLAALALPAEKRRVFDLGCGNGATAAFLANQGYDVTGVDPSTEGIAWANKAYPELKLRRGSAYEDLAGTFGTFPVVVSLEVVEHVYFPKTFAACVFALLEPGGTAIISTPYHGYIKNLVLALTGKLDQHFTALWDNGHIKFWSMRTLTLLLHEAGFRSVKYLRVGRIPPLAASMIAVAKKA